MTGNCDPALLPAGAQYADVLTSFIRVPTWNTPFAFTATEPSDYTVSVYVTDRQGATSSVGTVPVTVQWPSTSLAMSTPGTVGVALQDVPIAVALSVADESLLVSLIPLFWTYNTTTWAVWNTSGQPVPLTCGTVACGSWTY